ncbi:MAG TPA: DUF1588 domain-containing protein [Polyangia bacterium]
MMSLPTGPMPSCQRPSARTSPLARRLVLGGLIAAGAAGLSACGEERHWIDENGLTTATGGATPAPSAPGSNGPGAVTVAPAVPPGVTPPSAVSPAPLPAPRSLEVAPREVVRRLASVLWREPNAAALLIEEDATLKSSEDVRNLALRMLGDARAQAGVGGFYRWWLQQDRLAAIAKSPTRFPEFTAALRSDMGREAELLGTHLTLEANAALPALFTADFSFLNERLASVYGVPNVVGDEPRKVAVDAQTRAGVLTLPGVMAVTSMPTRTSPSLRGVFMNSQMFCLEVPPPPPGISPLTPPPPGAPSQTTRQELTAAVREPVCQGCHSLVDPPGFPFEGLDPIGRARTTENGLPVDTSATFREGGVVAGARAFGERLATSPSTRDCFVEQWLTYALGRPLSLTERSEVGGLSRDAAQSGYNLKQVIGTVLQSRAFLSSLSTR